MCTIWQHCWYLRCTEQSAVSDCFPFLSCFKDIIPYLFLGLPSVWESTLVSTTNKRQTPQLLRTIDAHTDRCISTPDAHTDHETSCLTGIGGGGWYFPGVKKPGREADHLHAVPRLRISGVTPTLPFVLSISVHW